MSKLWSSVLLLTCSIANAEVIDSTFLDSYHQQLQETVEKRIKDGKPVAEQVMLRYQNKSIDWHEGSQEALTIPNLCKTEDRVLEKCSSKCCGASIPISQADVGPDGLVISESGIYCLKEDILFEPSADNLAAITINADFVILDFSEHILTQSQTSFNAFDNITAVVINPGSNYVTVRNGTIIQFSNMGIFAKGSNMSSTDHQGILVEEMRVLNCGKIGTQPNDRIVFQARSAIGIDSSKDVLIRECLTAFTLGIIADGIDTQFSDNVFIKKSVAVDNEGQTESFGIAAFSGRDFLIKDCQAERINGIDFRSVGILVQEVSNVIIDSDIANENFSSNPAIGSKLVAGIMAFGPLSNVIITNCTSNDHTLDTQIVTTSTLAGIASVQARNVTIGYCQVGENRSQHSAVGALGVVSGIVNISGSSINVHDCAVTNNSINGVTAAQVQVLGIASQSSNDITVEDCVILGNLADGISANGAGISTILDNGVILRNCHAIGNRFATQNTTTVFSAGILVQSSQNVTVEKCNALNNSAPNNFQSNISGILALTSSAVLIKDCTASGQNSPHLLSRVVGIRLEGTSNLSEIIVEGCIMENNTNSTTPNLGIGMDVRGVQGATLFSNIAKGNGRGFLIEPLSGVNTQRCIVQANEASNSIILGFEDSNTVKNNAYLNNVSYNAALINYLNLPANTPIRIWTIGLVPSGPVARDIDNLDLR